MLVARLGRKASGRVCARRLLMSTASWVAASASSRRSRSETRMPRLFRPVARSGRKVSGRVCARRRYESTASWVAASASSRWSKSERPLPRLFRAHCKVGEEGVPVAFARGADQYRQPLWLRLAPPSRRPRLARRKPRLFRLPARSGGRRRGAFARAALMSTASLVAARASSRRPRLESNAEVIEAPREIGKESVGSHLREAPL